jgi:integrase
VSCAFPGAGARRSALFANFICDECFDVDVDLGLGMGARVDGEMEGYLQKLAREAAELESEAVAGGTHTTYATGVASLDKFMREHVGVEAKEMWEGLDVRGRSGAERAEAERRRAQFWRPLTLWVANAVLTGKQKASTMETYLDGGVAAKLRDMGIRVEDCPTKHWRVKKVMKGFRRREGDTGITVKEATAMDEELLAAMVEELRARRVANVKGDGVMGFFEARQAAIAFLLGFAGLARRSEIAGLELDRWSMDGDAIRVEWSGAGYRRAKADQESRGQVSFLPSVVLGFPLGRWMEAHTEELRREGVKGKAKFFRNVLKHKESWAESGEAVNKVLKRVVKHTLERGEWPRQRTGTYSSHSMRRGGAQYMRDMGVPRDLIKLAGRWRSDAVDKYLRTASVKTKIAVSKIFKGIENVAKQILKSNA